MKSKAWSLVWRTIRLAAVFFMLFFFLLFSFFKMLHTFHFITDKYLLRIPTILSLLFSIGIVVYIFIDSNRGKYARINNWVSNNSSKLILYYIVFNIIFLSIKSDILWGLDELKDILSLQWTIFGISMTIFLVWDVLIIDYLKRQKPEAPTDDFPTQTVKYIQEKGTFYEKASLLFNSVYLLFINLLVLIVATTIVYFNSDKITALVQNVVILSFYLCTNTVFALFSDILTPLNEEKKAMLSASKVTKADIELQDKIYDEVDKLTSTIEQIENLGSLDDEQKHKITRALLDDFQSRYSKKETDLQGKEGE